MLTRDFISASTCKYLVDNYGDVAVEWIADFENIVMKIVKKWDLEICGFESKSRFGSILYCKKNNKELVTKIIPPFCSRLLYEIKSYECINYSGFVNMIDFDMEFGCLLMDKIDNIVVVPMEKYCDLFHKMYRERHQSKSFAFPDYKEQLYCSLYNAQNTIIENNLKCCFELLPIIDKVFNDEFLDKKTHKYSLHGDVHPDNILFDGRELYLIDPIGFEGPFELEYARFLGTLIKNNRISTMDLDKIILDLSTNDISKFDILKMLTIDVTMRACNTFMEGNTKEEILESIEWCKKVWKIYNEHYISTKE